MRARVTRVARATVGGVCAYVAGGVLVALLTGTLGSGGSGLRSQAVVLLALTAAAAIFAGSLIFALGLGAASGWVWRVRRMTAAAWVFMAATVALAVQMPVILVSAGAGLMLLMLGVLWERLEARRCAPTTQDGRLSPNVPAPEAPGDVTPATESQISDGEGKFPPPEQTAGYADNRE